MTREEATAQFAERLVAFETPWRWRALAEQRVGELLAAARTAADHSLQLRVHRQQPHLQAAELRSRVCQALTELRPREMARAGESPFEYRDRTDDRGLLQPLVTGVARHRLVHARRSELEQPRQVIAADEVPGRAHDVRSQDVALVHRSLDRGVAVAVVQAQ